ncbi:hypothetical protein C8A03DRAFT_19574 [Achaetomium macrosporum]|uniref:Uncharacterized protein n=1 Tax=Achaetomium macrosporum TaxID=79813 RepID=A0AAN7H6S3_9PEZI|nr:hypothetical protein C8A03DRAFT_19574 [Achaetomium macrosporum]
MSSTSLAPLRGGLRWPLLVSPVSYIAALARCPTVCRGTDDCARAPPQRRRWPCPGAVQRGIWEDSEGAREHPVCAEGWALWVLGGSPDLLTKPPGVPTGWGRPLQG